MEGKLPRMAENGDALWVRGREMPQFGYEDGCNGLILFVNENGRERLRTRTNHPPRIRGSRFCAASVEKPGPFVALRSGSESVARRLASAM